MWTALAAALLMTTTGQGEPVKPIILVVEPQERGVIIRVEGESANPVEAAYQLEVTGGGNRTVQRGTAHLVPNIPLTLMTLTLTTGPAWTARLRVTPGHGNAYEETRSGSAANPD